MKLILALVKILVIFSSFTLSTAKPDVEDVPVAAESKLIPLKPVPYAEEQRRQPNPRPIIGVLVDRYYGNWQPKGYTQYVAASYVKLVEGGGGRVVPIMTTGSSKYLEKIFRSINGLLLPGVLVNFRSSNYERAANILMDLATTANDNGVYFPVWGECFGLEFLLGRAAGAHNKIRNHCGTDNITLSLNFTDEADSSRLYSGAPKSVMKILATKSVTTQAHHKCVFMKTFNELELHKFYRVLSTNYDAQTNEIFVSSVESINYPFYGLGFHPEKNLYEWKKTRNNSHTSEAIECAQYFARFLVNEARWNSHKFKTEAEESRALIYNYSPLYSEPNDPRFTQIYFFKPNKI